MSKRLFHLSFFSHSTPKSRASRVKYYESKPHLFKRLTLIRPPDLTAKNITFPINIPIRIRYIFKPSKSIEHLKENDFLNFKEKSGNEILLYLERVSDLRPSEICGALLELGKRVKPEGVDWNTHDYVMGAKDFILPKIPQFSSITVQHLAIAFNRLGITDPLLWTSLQTNLNKSLHKLTASAFSKIFIIFSSPTHATKEFSQKLVSLLGVHASRMSGRDLVDVWEVCEKNGWMTEYLYENHFFFRAWKFPKGIGAEYYGRLIQLLIKRGEDFLATIPELKQYYKESIVQDMINALKELKKLVQISNLDTVRSGLEAELIFFKTKFKMIENAKLFNIVVNDIEYYKEKEAEKRKIKGGKED